MSPFLSYAVGCVSGPVCWWLCVIIWISWVNLGSDLLPCLCLMIAGQLMGPVAVTAPAQKLWDDAPVVRSLPVLSLPLAHPPWWSSLPLAAS